MEPDKMKLESMNIPEHKKQLLKESFPEVFGEGDAIDFEKLKAALGEQVEQPGKERFGLSWAGKSKLFQLIQEPSRGTLRPAKEESLNWDSTEHVFIEGDNLEALKLLQKSYLGKIKMIYIDPPYNTGGDFVYPDDFSESINTYLEYTGQKSTEGVQFGTNLETDGRFHSKWLNMIFPRIFVARNLLTEDGVIFISIDETEIHSLKTLCMEIFGPDNFAGEIIWKNSSKNDQAYVSIQHEYILCFVKNKSSNHGDWIELKEGLNDIYKAFASFLKKYGTDWQKIHQTAIEYYNSFSEANPIYSSKHYSWMDQKGVYFPADISGPNYGQYRYDVFHPKTGKKCKEPASGWRFPEETMKDRIKNDLIHFGEDETTVPKNKVYLKDTEYHSLTSIKYKDGRAATNHLAELLGGNVFTNPKDTFLLARFMRAVGVKNNDLVLDFFAGSCTTAQSVLDLNIEDGGNRKFIMVQLPEPCAPDSAPFKAGYKTIAEIGKERIRRVSKKIKDGKINKLDFEDNKQNVGFRVFKLDTSNFKQWQAKTEDGVEAVKKEVELFVDPFIPGRTEEDILTEILLKSGFELSAKIEEVKIAKKKVYSIAEGALLICLEDELTDGFIKAVAEKEPHQFICLDKAFHEKDDLKANALLTFKSKQHSDGTPKTIFKTV